jgi:hypothetical protein
MEKLEASLMQAENMHVSPRAASLHGDLTGQSFKSAPEEQHIPDFALPLFVTIDVAQLSGPGLRPGLS